jgi:hypothetical protein
LNPNWTAMQGFSPLVQGTAPVSNNLKGINTSLDALLAAIGKQPYIGGTGPNPAPTPVQPPDATPPAPGETPSRAWYDFLVASYPEGIGTPWTTYEQWVSNYNSGGYRPL